MNLRRPTICFVVGQLPGSGSERVVANIAKATYDKGHDVEVVAIRRISAETGIPAGVRVSTLNANRTLLALPALASRLRRLAPTVVMSSLGHINLAILAIQSLLLPASACVVREANTPSRELASHRDSRWLRLGYRKLYPRAALVICPSQQIAAELAGDFGVPSRRIRVMANPVDAAFIRSSAQATQRERGPGPRFISVGRLTTAKAIDDMLGMLAACRADAHLTIVGDGPERGRLEAMVHAQKLEQRVRFTGYLQAPWPLISGADALLLTSVYEGMPNAALEALACGTPVIATPETGGLPELAAQADGDGVVVAARGQPFVEAMNNVTAHEKCAPAPSLLPPAFAMDQAAGAVVAELERLLTAAEPRR